MFLNLSKVVYIFISTKYCCCSLHFSIVSRSHKAEKTILCSPLCIFFLLLRTEVATEEKTRQAINVKIVQKT